MGGISAGVPLEPVCPDTTCTDGVTCTSVVTVAQGTDLQMLAGTAADGDCLALEPGTYGDVDLPPGVSMLGRAAAEVSVGAVTAAGDTSMRGITITGGLFMQGPGSLTLDRVNVSGSAEGGIVVDSATVTVLDSCIVGNANTGLFAGCGTSCTCPPVLALDMQRTFVAQNHNVGLYLNGMNASLSDVMVLESVPINFQGGLGIYASFCTNITATKLLVADNPTEGIFLQGAGATLGPDVHVERNDLGGIAACGVPSMLDVSLTGFTLADNRIFGLLIGGSSSTGQLEDGSISGTQLGVIPTMNGGSAMVGDAIDWMSDAALTVADTVQISQSGRAPAVIDASSNGSFNATLVGADATIGIFLQNGAAPQVGPGIMQTQAVPALDFIPCTLSP
jgi:hypothetical protein